MTLHVVDVAVARRRPPREDSWRRYVVEADSPGHALLLALQWAHCPRGVVMPVRSEYRGLYENQADESAVEILTEMRAAVARLKGERDA